MSNKFLSGKNPVGTKGGYVPFLHFHDRDPMPYDWQNYFLLDLWLNTDSQELFYLASLAGNSAMWLPISGGTGSMVTLSGNTGTATPSGGNINLLTANSTATFVGASPTADDVTLDFGISNLVLGSSLAAVTTGDFNVGIGVGSLISITSGDTNSSVGYASSVLIADGSSNCAFGTNSLAANVSGVSNCAFGASALQLATGNSNTALGGGAGVFLLSGDENVLIGIGAGINYVGAESGNIVIDNDGVAAESDTTRIGATQTTCYIAGIENVNVGSSTVKLVSMASDKLGTINLVQGTGITITPTANTITIAGSGTTNLNYTAIDDTDSPYTVLTTDDFISVDCSVGVVTVDLPDPGTAGQVYIVKDRTGSAVTNNIKVTTVSSVANIDGATTFVMNSNYEVAQFIDNGTTWEVF